MELVTKEEFKKLIDSYYEQEKRFDTINSILPLSPESPFLMWGYDMFHKLLEAYFTEDGVDWIAYYLYENPEKCYYIDEVRVPLETIDDLWKIIKDCRK